MSFLSNKLLWPTISFGVLLAITTTQIAPLVLARPNSDEVQLDKPNPKCVRISIDMCSDIQYNMTIFPNLLKHAKQDEAEAEIKQYDMLVKVQCSPDFKFFLCTLFTPVCTILNDPIPPCRHLCLSAKSGCEALMRKFGYQWPEIFNCDKFPDANSGMCVGETRSSSENDEELGSVDIQSGAGKQREPELECPHTMKVINQNRPSLLVANTSVVQCSLPCQNDGVVNLFFSVQIHHYLRLWTGAWAVACFVCTLFTIITFLIDLDRFEFPERAILYMAVCYLMVSVTYMIGLVAEDSLSCSALSATKLPLVTQGIDNFACTAMAVAHYFFTSAGMLWWLALCFSWFLVTTLKWGEAPVGQVFASYFNAFAWLLPAAGVIGALSTGAIDGDLFTGVCSVGNLRPSALFNFVVLPQIVAEAIGLVLFTVGFISIMRIRSYIKGHRFIVPRYAAENAEATEKVGRLMLRISSFSLIYIVPMAIGTMCTYYQSQNMEEWMTNWYSTRCLHAQRSAFGFTQPREQCPTTILATVSADSSMPPAIVSHSTPEPALFFLKYLAHFTIGIACAVWTVNGKTVQSYGDFMTRVFHGGRARVPTR